MSVKKHTEVEVRFLEINPDIIKKKLLELGAQDYGEDLLKEAIFYDQQTNWISENKMVRVRKTKSGIKLTFKHHPKAGISATKEIELEINDFDNAIAFLENIGLLFKRIQEKKRHTFKKGDVTFDIDEWPKIPTYLEIEGNNPKIIKDFAIKLGFDWKLRNTTNAANVIEKIYNIPVRSYQFFTFSKIK